MPKISTYSVEFKKQMVKEYLQSKDKYGTMREFSKANDLNDSTFGQWVIQYEPLLSNLKVNPVAFRDFISTVAPFSIVNIVTVTNLTTALFHGCKRNIDEEFMFLYGDRIVEMIIPGTETTIIFA